MLNNKNITIEEFNIEFNDDKEIYEGTAIWHEEDETLNKDYEEGAPGKVYMGEPSLNRQAVVVTISKEGEPVYMDGFDEILNTEENDWVLDDIDDEALTIREEYYEGH